MVHLSQWKKIKFFEVLLTGFIVLIFCLSALQSMFFLFDENQNLEQEYSQEYDIEQTAFLLFEGARNDFEAYLLAYVSQAENITKRDVLESLHFFEIRSEKFLISEKLRHNGVVDESQSLVLLIQDHLETIRSTIEENEIALPLDVILREWVKLDSVFPLLQAKILENRNNKHMEEVRREHWGLLFAILSMTIAGLGLIILFILKLKKLERLNAEKQKIMGLLEPRSAAIEASMDGIAIMDAEGDIRYANKSLADGHAYERPEDLVGCSWTVLYTSEQKKWFEQDVFPILEEEGQWHGHCRGLRQDLTEYYQDISISKVADGGMVFVARDYTEFLESTALSNRRLAAIEAARDGIALMDPDGKLTYLNKSFQDLHGIEEDALHGYLGCFWENLHQGEGQENIIETVIPTLQKEGYWRGMASIEREGGTIHTEIAITKLSDGGLVATLRDITDRLKADDEKEELQKQFYQAQKMEAIGRLAGGIAHDFNNILASMMGYTEFLLEDLTDQPKQQKFAHQIMRGGMQAKHLVEQILSFSRRQESARISLDLIETVHETVAMLRSTLPATVSLKTDINLDDAYIEANQTQISQTLMNLCVNAVDAMDDEHGALNICIDRMSAGKTIHSEMLADEIPAAEASPLVRLKDTDSKNCTVLELGTLARDQDYICLSVSDTGIGMPHELMEHIFEPFFTTKSVDKGTGLGLASVHGVMAGHQGAMVVESTVEEGTVFRLYFPASDAETSALSVDEGGSAKKGTGRILIVDDEEMVREMLLQRLHRLGYEAFACEAGDEAIDHLRENPGHYDLILSDHMMPRMTGLEMASHIHGDFPDLPIIILSGYSKKKLEDEMEKNSSIRAILKKPADVQTLLNTINAVLGAKRAAA